MMTHLGGGVGKTFSGNASATVPGFGGGVLGRSFYLNGNGKAFSPNTSTDGEVVCCSLEPSLIISLIRD